MTQRTRQARFIAKRPRTLQDQKTLNTQWWRKASCAEFECDSYMKGFVTKLAVDDLRVEYIRKQMNQMRIIEHKPIREFTERMGPDGLTIEFHFPPGQACFGGKHTVPVSREPLYLHQVTDSRQLISTNFDDWRNEWDENAFKLDHTRNKL